MPNTFSIDPESTGSSSSSDLARVCPVCAAEGPFPLAAAQNRFRLQECLHCGIVFLYPIPESGELNAYYTQDYYGEDRQKFHSVLERGILSLTRWKWNRLRPLFSPGDRMLDIGCGRGVLVQLARQADVEAYGLERHYPGAPNRPHVIYQDLADCDFPPAHFQGIVIWHVLEHLPDPVAALRRIHELLQPGGWVSVAVPNYGGAQAGASGPEWFHLDLPRHIWHLRPQVLERMLSRAGLRVMQRRTFSFEYDWFGTLQSWMNRWTGNNNRLYAMLKGEGGQSAGEKLSNLLLGFGARSAGAGQWALGRGARAGRHIDDPG